MADRHEVVEEREMEAQEMNSEEEALLHFGRYAEERAATPWEQRTFKEKLMHRLDRFFLFFLMIFFLAVVVDAAYKFWYVTNWRKIMEFALDLLSYFTTQENEEKLLEL